MYYIIEKDNTLRDEKYYDIFKAMEKMNLEYEVVEFTGPKDEIDIKTKRKDVFVYGSVKFAKVLSKYDFIPGSYYGNEHKYENYKKGYGDELINYKGRVCQFSDKIDFNGEVKFIKPSEDAKIFTGKIFTETNWNDFVYYTLSDKNSRIKKETKIMVSDYVRIKSEIRFWIINHKIATYSWYKFNEVGSLNVPKELFEYVDRLIEKYSPLDAYVLDIADTYDGYKVVEINCINSAGFYNGNVYKIIKALEE